MQQYKLKKIFAEVFIMIDNYVPHIFIFLCIMVVISLATIACKSTQVPTKPEILQHTTTIPVSGHNSLTCVERILSPRASIGSIYTLKLEFTQNYDELNVSKKDIILWIAEIQKSLLQQGIEINIEDTSLSLFDDTKPDPTSIFFIDSLRIEKISESLSVPNSYSGSDTSYSYSYYIAEISAYISHHNIIIWRGHVKTTSFDLLKSLQNVETPCVLCTVTIDHTYSSKLKKWVSTNPVIYLQDNFSSYYNNTISEEVHKQQLVHFAVSSLLSYLKGAQ